MSKIKYHPSDSTLALFASAELDSASSIMTSAHLEFCSACRQRIENLEDGYAKELADTPAPTEPMSADTQMLEAMFGHILGQLDSVPETVDPAEDHPERRVLELEGKTFSLPRVFQNHGDKIGAWNRLPGKLKRASVATGGQSKMNFIYMDSDSALPEHTHQGTELTLVLSGHFEDESARYGPGDFIVQTGEHRHTPKTRKGENCLCLTLLDAPLHFTSGLSTLLNPFSQLFFK